MKITVIGAGSWGTAVAVHLAKVHPGLDHISLCPRDEKHAAIISEERKNEKYLPGIHLPKHLNITTHWSSLFKETFELNHLLIIATPLAGLRELVENILKNNHFPKSWIWLCKGIDPNNGKLAHEIIEEVFQREKERSNPILYGVLSGPSFAIEVAKGLPCALTIASRSTELCDFTQQVMHHGNMRIYKTDDIVGVELGGAVKNILAIATGITDGLHLGLNARAALITRGMAEMTRLGLAMGAHSETFSGLTGMGDLILTATGDLSRNRKVGIELAKGHALKTILENLGHVAEGVRCAHAVLGLANRYQVEMPIVEVVCAVLDGKKNAHEAVFQIMSRDPKHE
jgi:glycerol-3-phosphate dehydrogenase (NAD(P)+)